MMEAILKKIGVSTVYLFGSRASGKTGALSDYDIGIILKDSLPETQYFDKKMQLMRIFSEYFKHPRVDVIILNSAPPLLAMNIIDGGKLLFDFSPSDRVDRETKITMAYLDRLPYEERHFETLIKSV